MSNIQPYRGGGAVSPRQARSLNKSLSQVEATTSLTMARVEATAELQAVKTDAVSYVGARAMHAVTMLSTLEMQLAQTCPQASGRLSLIADMTSLSLADLAQQTAHRVRPL